MSIASHSIGDFGIIRTNPSMNICFETFGCRLNRSETLDDEAKCIAKGHKIVRNHAEADMIVVRACSVTARAQRDCEKMVAHLREKYPGKRLFLTGCIEGAKKFEVSNVSRNPDGTAKISVPRRTARAYLKVQDGCSCGCTFCIVPKFRGNPISIPFTEVLDKAKRFVEAGYHEIVVTGCNLMLYSSEGRGIADLAAAIAAISPECRVRLGSIEPGAQALDVVHALAENENICRFLHLSIQSGSDMILKAMRRPYSVKAVDAVASEATRLMPLICLGCDMIAGFPGESEIDFRLSKGLLVRHRFANVHAFPFSERPGTLAALIMHNRILPELRRKRARDLADIGAGNLRQFAKSFIGKKVDVVIEDEESLSGWTGEYLKMELSRGARPFASTMWKGAKAMRKKLVRFKVVTSHMGTLYGEPV